jgi:heat shock protein HspQ
MWEHPTVADYKVVRDKLIKYQGCIVDAQPDGSVHIQINGQALNLSEEQAGLVYQLLSDVTQYVGHLTESQMNKATDRAEAEDAE